jgi:hypothetical protein
MLYVILHHGTVEELPEAKKIIAVDGVLACYDAQGEALKVYDRHQVLMFSHDDRAKRVAEMWRAESQESA